MSKNLCILVIDDNIEVLCKVTKFLNHEGYQVHLSNNAKDANCIAGQLLPDLILCNIAMAVCGGEKARLELGHISEEQGIPFVFYVQSGNPEQIAEFPGSGMMAGKKKPLMIENLF